MRRIVASEFVSADGYIAGPEGGMSWVAGRFNDEMARYAGGLMASMDTVLHGRLTYQIMAGAWPSFTESQSPGADAMNSVKKVVLSRTLKEAPWGKYAPATVIGDRVEERIRGLKEEPGKSIVVYGSANSVQGLTRMGLIDEYQLLVHPLFLGGGKPLFANMEKLVDLKLLRAQTYSNGVCLLCYQPARLEGKS